MKGKVFLVLACIYALLFLLKKSETHFFFISSYLSDALALPLVLGGMEYLLRWLYRSDFETRWIHMFLVGTVFSIWFEFLLPQWDQRFTADYWDVVAYFFGGVFWMLIFPPSLKTQAKLNA